MSIGDPTKHSPLWTNRSWFIIFALASSLAITAGCAAPPAQQDAGTMTDGDSRRDVAQTANDASDISDVVGDASSQDDDATDGADAPLHIPDDHPRPDESTWVCDQDGAPIDYKPIDEPFELPDNDFAYQPYTAERLLHEFGGSGASGVKTMQPSPDHSLYASQVDAFAVEDGENVTLHVAMWGQGAPFDDAHLQGTILVEYQPVQATFEIWDDERQNVTYETTDTGIDTPVNTEVVLVDITIPAEVFAENGAHELSVFLQIASPGTTHVALVWRTFVFYGGYSRFTHPCFPATSDTEITDEENAVIETLYHMTSAHLYPEGETGEEIKSVHQVAPGEAVTLKFFKTTRWINVRQPAVLQPLLSGRPIGEPTYVYPPISNGSGGATNLREELEIQMPQDPGLYPVTIAGFDDAHLLLRDHHGVGYRGVSSGGLHASSNTVWYEVVEGP